MTTSQHDHNANQGNADEDLKIVKVVKKLQDGERLTSAIFIVTVGPGHEDLPDDQPKVVAAIVEYLYTGNFWVNQKPSSDLGEKQEAALVLAHLYIAADKYQLDRLKVLTVARLEGYTSLLGLKIYWLNIAQLIYSSTPDSDAVYPTFLRSLVLKWMESEQTIFGFVNMCVIERYVEQGGRLAVDILRVQRHYWLRRVQTRNAVIQKERDHHRTAHNECSELMGPERDLHHGDLDDQGSKVEEFMEVSKIPPVEAHPTHVEEEETGTSIA
ncbi:MAG: hypothetical protein Q9207_000854 [Kuettlingeria erythrocarpa]